MTDSVAIRLPAADAAALWLSGIPARLVAVCVTLCLAATAAAVEGRAHGLGKAADKVLLVGTRPGMFLALLLGVWLSQQASATESALAAPARWPAVASRALVAWLAGALLLLITAAACTALSAALGDGASVSAAGGVVLAGGFYATLGAGAGSCGRGAAIAALTFVATVDTLIPVADPGAGRFLPGGASAALSGGLDGMLPGWLGAVVLVGYALVLVLLASYLLIRRDLDGA